MSMKSNAEKKIKPPRQNNKFLGVIDKTYYGKKRNKPIKIYGHKFYKNNGIANRNYYVIWKTTRKNLINKTYHGKFYKTRKQALKKIKNKTIKNKK